MRERETDRQTKEKIDRKMGYFGLILFLFLSFLIFTLPLTSPPALNPPSSFYIMSLGTTGVLALFAVLAVHSATAVRVTIDNLRPRTDAATGAIIDAHDGSITQVSPPSLAADSHEKRGRRLCIDGRKRERGERYAATDMERDRQVHGTRATEVSIEAPTGRHATGTETDA